MSDPASTPTAPQAPPNPPHRRSGLGQIRLGVLVSGNGSNLQAILDAVAEGSLKADVALVVSNRADARALERAARAGVETVLVPHGAYKSRAEFETELVKQLVARAVDWVVLAGFMRVLGKRFLETFGDRTVNLHPSLLPSFPGLDAARQALDYGVRVTGCTVHLVDEGVDTGPILAQQAVPIHDADTLETLLERLHAAEHSLLVSVLRRLTVSRLTVERAPAGRAQVRWLPERLG
jgi:phosphoribosylglycinamide formyltransferase 1